MTKETRTFGSTGVKFVSVHTTLLGGMMNIFTHHKHKSVHSLVACFIILTILVSALSACNMNVVIPTPSTGSIVESTASQNNLATQALPSPSPTDIANEIPTLVNDLALDYFPSELNFIDGRNVKEMVSSVGIDEITSLECAFDENENIVAYNLKNDGKDLWVVNPLIEKGFRWNFDINENGQYILHNALEEWKYKPYPIEGIKYVKPDELPVTFWDESDPVREDEKYPWPSEGSLAVFDGEGDVLMYYSKYENAWWFAGYQSELPGNMVYRQSSMSLALTGIRYKPVDERVWTGPDLNERWQEIRNSVDWVAYTRRTGNYISLESFSNRVSNGEVFEYQSMLYDLATQEYQLTNLSNKIKIYFQTQMYDTGSINYAYESAFHAPYHRLPNYGLATGILLNPDNSISIICRSGEDVIQRSQSPYSHFIGLGSLPFLYDNVNWLAASNTAIKEGFKSFDHSFFNILTRDESSAWSFRVTDYDFSIFQLLPTLGGELLLSALTPIIYPNIENPHPRQ